METESIKDWIVENRAIISELAESLIEICKTGSTSYNELIRKLTKVKLNVKYTSEPIDHVLTKVVEIAMNEVEEEMRTLPIVRGENVTK